MFDIFLLLLGLIALVIGGDLLVRGAVGLAEKLSIPSLVIGLTVVAFGTSAPELFISVQAALDGVGGIAIGNVIGSNIANVLLVLGLPALMAPLLCDEDGIGRNILVMIGFTLVFMTMLNDGELQRFDGIVLVILLLLYLYGQVRVAFRHEKRGQYDVNDYHEEVSNIPDSGIRIGLLLLVGLILLPVGAELTVTSASSIAKSLNISDAVIGLTVVAIGTSLPEIATALMATLRNNSSLALGNIVGSNIFNIGSIMGIASFIQPMSVDAHLLKLDMWVMLACAILIAVLAHYKVTVGKGIGIFLTCLYAGYLTLVFVS